MPIYKLKSKSKKRIAKLLNKIQEQGRAWANSEYEFRDAERLSKAGKITVVVSKWNFLSVQRTKRQYRELCLFASYNEAREHGGPIVR